MKYEKIPHQIIYNKIDNSYGLLNSINSSDIFNSLACHKEVSIKNIEELLGFLKKDKTQKEFSDIKQINFDSFKKHLVIIDSFLNILEEYIQTEIVIYYIYHCNTRIKKRK